MMMNQKRSKRFKPIHNLAQQKEDVAAQTLGKMQRELSSHQLKLGELQGFYQDYTERFNRQGVKGMSIIQVQSYQKFISQLEVAIIEQKKHISRVAEACDSSRADWTQERQKTQVLEKVISRFQKQEQKMDNRREQRQSDELVSIRFWHKNKSN